jgi:hypothetical protein
MKIFELFLVLYEPVRLSAALLAACGWRDRLGAELNWHGMIWVEEVERWISV